MSKPTTAAGLKHLDVLVPAWLHEKIKTAAGQDTLSMNDWMRVTALARLRAGASETDNSSA